MENNKCYIKYEKYVHYEINQTYIMIKLKKLF